MPGRRGPKPPGTLEFTVFAVLASIAMSPKTVREISRETGIGSTIVKERVSTLEKLGWIIKRASDVRWCMIVTLAPLSAPEPKTLRSGALPELNTVVTQDPVLGNGLVRPVKPIGEDFEAPDGSGVVQDPPVAADWRTVADKLSELWKVPVKLDGSEVSVGKLEHCMYCNVSSPLKYGGKPICPKCARDRG